MHIPGEYGFGKVGRDLYILRRPGRSQESLRTLDDLLFKLLEYADGKDENCRILPVEFDPPVKFNDGEKYVEFCLTDIDEKIISAVVAGYNNKNHAGEEQEKVELKFNHNDRNDLFVIEGPNFRHVENLTGILYSIAEGSRKHYDKLIVPVFKDDSLKPQERKTISGVIDSLNDKKHNVEEIYATDIDYTFSCNANGLYVVEGHNFRHPKDFVGMLYSVVEQSKTNNKLIALVFKDDSLRAEEKELIEYLLDGLNYIKVREP